MIGLGLRLAFGGGRWSLVPTIMAAIAVGFGTAILLFALSFEPALQARYDHEAWRETPGAVDPSATPDDRSALLSLTHDFYAGQPLARIDLAALGAHAPVPPGLPRIPAPGEAFVSPALAQLIAATPADQLGNRFGRVVGEIGDAGLAAPDELAVVQGMSAAQLRAAGSRQVDSFDTHGRLPAFNFVIALIVAIAVVGAIAPVAVFVATATRLAAARRERRLVALRLSGATPAQVAILGAVDALLIAGPGALVGVVLFFALRPFVAQFPLGSLSWFPDAISPPALPAIALVAAVPVVGSAAAVLALRRMAISPLGVARRVTGRPLSRLRLVPLVIALAAFAFSVTVGPTGFRDTVLIGVGGSFFGIIVGIVIAGPWLTALVGRVLASGGGPVRLLAGAHLMDDPGAAFGSVAGVVMAVFVASAFFGFVAYTSEISGSNNVPVRSSTVSVTVPNGGGSAAEAAAAELQRLAGVTAVAVVRDAEVLAPGSSGNGAQHAWIVSCAALLQAADLPGATCGAAGVHRVASTQLPNGAVLEGLGLGSSSDRPDVVRVGVVPGVDSDQFTIDAAGLGLVANRRELPSFLIDPSAIANGGAGIRPLLVLAATNGDPAVIERVRTALESALSTSGPATGPELAPDTIKVIEELTRVVSLGVVLTLLVAGCSLAVAVAGGLLDRRRPFALLRMAGVPVGRLRAVLAVEAAAPLVTIAILSAILGVAVSQLVLRVAGAPSVPPPNASVVALLVVSVAGALAVVSMVMPLVRSVTDMEETRFE